MSSSEEGKRPETLTPIVELHEGCGLAIHDDGETKRLAPYGSVQEGQPLNGKAVYAPKGDGTYERVHYGPAQVATPAYRSGWERTFGQNGGVS
jgi:hypothetical protein